MNFLIRRAQNGDSEAFIQLMEKNKQTMYKVAHGFLKNENDIADALQETVLSAFEHITDLKQPSYFKTWLIRILINCCYTILRDKKRIEPQENINIDSHAETPDSNLAFREMVGILPEDSKLIFLLYYGECFTTREISIVLDINESTVRSRLRRGRMQIKEWLLANE